MIDFKQYKICIGIYDAFFTLKCKIYNHLHLSVLKGKKTLLLA